MGQPGANVALAAGKVGELRLGLAKPSVEVRAPSPQVTPSHRPDFAVQLTVNGAETSTLRVPDSRSTRSTRRASSLGSRRRRCRHAAALWSTA